MKKKYSDKSMCPPTAKEPVPSYGEIDVRLKVPATDMTFFSELASRMGWFFKTKEKKKTQLEMSLEDLEQGRTTRYSSSTELFDSLGI